MAATVAVISTRRNEPRRVEIPRLDGLQLGEARFAQRLDDGFARGSVVVPGERQLPHQVRVGLDDPVNRTQDAGEASDAFLAAQAADLKRLALNGHVSMVLGSGPTPGEVP